MRRNSQKSRKFKILYLDATDCTYHIYRLRHVGTFFDKRSVYYFLSLIMGEPTLKKTNLRSVSQSEVSFPVYDHMIEICKKLQKLNSCFSRTGLGSVRPYFARVL